MGAVRFAYDAAGRRRTVTDESENVTTELTYSPDGDLRARLQTGPFAHWTDRDGSPTTTIQDDFLFYDGRGKALEAQTVHETLTNRYTDLGALERMLSEKFRGGETDEQYLTDALGNRREKDTDAGARTVYHYEPGTGRLEWTDPDQLRR